MQNAEFGIQNSEFGMKNAEWEYDLIRLCGAGARPHPALRSHLPLKGKAKGRKAHKQKAFPCGDVGFADQGQSCLQRGRMRSSPSSLFDINPPAVVQSPQRGFP